MQAGKLPAAWKEARAALKRWPNDARLNFVTGLVCLARSKKLDAQSYFTKSIKLGSNIAAPYINLALLKLEARQHDVALKLLHKAATLFPQEAEVHSTLAHASRSAALMPHALTHIDTALSLAPAKPDYLYLKALTQRDLGDLPSAIATLTTLLSHSPDDIKALGLISYLYAFTNQPDQAMQAAQHAANIAPLDTDALENLAWRHIELGQTDAARALFETMNAASPHTPDTLRMLARLADLATLPTLAQQITTSQKQTKSPLAQGQLSLASATIAQRLDETASADQHLLAANQKLAIARPHDMQADQAHLDHVLSAYQTFSTAPRDAFTPLQQTPIFVLGMPRSGTTLLERLISTHPDVAALGEVAVTGRAFYNAQHADQSAGQATDQTDPAPLLDALTALHTAYPRYQALVAQHHPHQPAFTIDKMPANYQYIGYLNHIFPACRIILITRNAKDTALSLFETYFDGAAQNYTFSETGIQQKRAQYDQAIAYWAAQNADFLTVSYEDLVTQPQDTLTKICTFCDLGFDAVMLHPDQNNGSIRTASHQQARATLNANSIDRWKNHATLLPEIFGTPD